MDGFSAFQWLLLFGMIMAIVQLHFIHRAARRTADTTYRVLEYLGERDMQSREAGSGVFDAMFERNE